MAPRQYLGRSRNYVEGKRVINHESLKIPSLLASGAHTLATTNDGMLGDKVVASLADKRVGRIVGERLKRESAASKKADPKASEDYKKDAITQASHSNPKFLSTRKGKAIAAGGALATVGALGGAYAYKKHLDKKREEANER